MALSRPALHVPMTTPQRSAGICSAARSQVSIASSAATNAKSTARSRKPCDDPRTRDTVLAIADELTEDDLVLRYRTDETDDALHGEEGTFTICSFWMVSALIAIGEVDRGRRLCEKLLSFASSLQLYAQEVYP